MMRFVAMRMRVTVAAVNVRGVVLLILLAQMIVSDVSPCMRVPVRRGRDAPTKNQDRKQPASHAFWCFGACHTRAPSAQPIAQVCRINMYRLFGTLYFGYFGFRDSSGVKHCCLECSV